MGKRKRKNKDLFITLAEKYRDTAKPKCEHFGECGGCLFQDIDYNNQLELKKEYLNALFEDVLSVDEVIASSPYQYRNRMDFVAAFSKRGLRQRGNFKEVVDIADCKLLQKKSNDFWKIIRPEILKIQDYNYLSHEGFLRYCVIRQTHFTEELMCSFVLKEDKELPESLLEEAKKYCDSVGVILSDGLADVSYGPVLSYYNNDHIIEKFGNIKFKIRPNSFFQSNSKCAVAMYSRIKEFVKGRTVDLYSGVGSISLSIADSVETLTGVEIVKEAVEAADENRKLNNIENVNFICEDARVFMRENEKKFDTLILDPPRCGIHPKMIKSINYFSPKQIIYMSCNPATFKDDLLKLENYKLESFEAYDMFAQTPHIETLALLTRK